MPPKRFARKEAPVKRPPPMGRTEPEPVAGPPNGETNFEAFDAYEEELAWCIHRLKLSLNTKNLTTKQAEDIRKSVHILENPSESVVKKRCIMKTNLGNYRQQMELEKKKTPLELRGAGLKEGAQTSGHFKRKAAEKGETDNFAFKPSDNSFRFNFVLNQE